MPKQQFKSSLGRAIVNSKGRRKKKELRYNVRSKARIPKPILLGRTAVQESDRDAAQKEQRDLKTKLEATDFGEMLLEAQMMQQAYSGKGGYAVILPEDEQTAEDNFTKQQEQTEIFDYECLPVPRRPTWSKEMSKEDLNENEETLFLDWRRSVAMTSQTRSEVQVSPYEKNLQVWRQLWRVVERSDLLVQIVDARNPLAYLSKDLFKYVDEVSEFLNKGNKQKMVVVNKADYLSLEQRVFWVRYFKSQGIAVAFFSAISEQIRQDLLSNAKNEQLNSEQIAHIVKNTESSKTQSTTVQSASTEEDLEAMARVLNSEELLETFKTTITNEQKVLLS